MVPMIGQLAPPLVSLTAKQKADLYAELQSLSA